MIKQRFAGVALSPSGAMSAAWMAQRRGGAGFKDDGVAAADFDPGDMDGLAAFLERTSAGVVAVDGGAGSADDACRAEALRQIAARLGVATLTVTRRALVVAVEDFTPRQNSPCRDCCALVIGRRMLLRAWRTDDGSDRRAVAILLALHVAHLDEPGRGA